MPASVDMNRGRPRVRRFPWKLSLLALALVILAGWKLFSDKAEFSREIDRFDGSSVRIPASAIFFGTRAHDGILTQMQAKPFNADEGAQEFRPQRVLAPQPPIKDFPVVSAKEAAGQLSEAELVLGVTVGGQSRAYPINMLTGPRREILNDTLGGHAIAATW